MDYQPSFLSDASVHDTGSPMSAAGILSPIWRWKYFIVAVTLGLVVIATIGLISIPKEFTATGSVIVDPIGPEAVNLGRVLPDAPIERDTLASELEILNSRGLLESVVKQLNLTSNPELNPDLGTSSWFTATDRILRFVEHWLPGARYPDPDQEVTEAQKSSR